MLCAIDRDEAGRRVLLNDGQELVNALPRKLTSLELGQNCEIVDVVLVRVGGYFPKQAIQSRRLEVPDGMGDDIAAELVTLAFHKTQAASWEELNALGEDFVSFWEIRVSLVCDAGKALDIFDGQLAPGCLNLNGCFSLYLCFLRFFCLLHVVADRLR